MTDQTSRSAPESSVAEVADGDRTAVIVALLRDAKERADRAESALREIAEFDQEDWPFGAGFKAANFFAGRAQDALAARSPSRTERKLDD